MGPYWYDNLESSPFAHWKPKITRLDIAIDTVHFPHFKQTFNAPGSRVFAYIGSDVPEKGIKILHELFKRVRYTLHMYGNISNPIVNLPNVHYHGYTTITPQFCSDLCKTADIFVNTSISDANPTTCTEAGSLGLIVLCTPQSGYWPNQPFWSLNPTNVEEMVEVLHNVQSMPNKQLIDQSLKQRQWVESCNWDKFCTTVSNKILSAIK